jgi:class 3 adenylate cyclase
MVSALVVMRVQWRWALLLLLSAMGHAVGSAALYMHVSVGVAVHHVIETILFPALFLSLSAYLYEHSTREAFLANHLLDLEKAKSENLLHNVLPDTIADRLKDSSELIADDHPEVTVLFADVVNFTPFCAQKSAREVVAFLNVVFSRFDRLVEEHRLEKIKTVGDCYMVIAGAPLARKDHVEQMARFALALQREAEQSGQELGVSVEFRIGMHTGPLVAGVIGEKRFLYDVWGDTVNTASRLESHGVPRCIHVSKEIVERLEGQFQFTRRGLVEIKGKGTIDTWFLDAETGQTSSTPVAIVASNK